MADKLKVRFFGIKRPWGTTTRVNNVVTVDDAFSDSGVLNVALLSNPATGMLVTLPTAGIYYLYGGTSTSPKLLTRVEVLNPTGSAATFRLAMMTTPSGSPTAGNAFLAWDTSLPALNVFKWTGYVPLINRYLYGQGSVSGLIFYFDVTEIDRR